VTRIDETPQEALRSSEARLAAGVDLAGLGFYEIDFDQGVAYIDDRFRDLCGVPPDRERGLQPLDFWIDHLHPDDRARVLQAREALHDGRLERLSLEYRFLHPVQGEKWMKHLGRIAARDATGRAVRAYGVLRDITDRKLAEDELHDLSRRLIAAHEEERALLARELHDDVSQRLAVLAIEAGRAELAAPEGAQADALRAVREGLTRLSEDVHSLAYQLHPSVLEELGLAEALRAECERRDRQGSLDLSVDLDPLPAVVEPAAALCLFRVAQEALNNVARHAGVREASVTLRQADGGLLLAVSDGGAGFDPANTGKGMRLGLASMRERVRLVRGTLDIESAPGQGTTIVAWVPAEGDAR
jgi:signal transduction histidine kinase